MIDDVRIQNYRSLLDTRISLNPGLNVLVGANGSGKTNLISFFDFLSALLSEGVPAAFDRAGGAAHAFSVESMRQAEPTLQFSIRGSVQRERGARFTSSSEPSVPYTHYRYECTITYNKTLRVVFISTESISLSGATVPQFLVQRATVVSDGDQAANQVLFPYTQGELHDYLQRNSYPKDESTLGERLGARLSPEWSLLSYLEHEHSVFGAVIASLVSLASINIRPEAARQTASISDVSTLKDNGAGLVSVLYRLKRGQFFPVTRRRFLRTHGRDEQRAVFKSIINWVSEVNPDIVDIEITPNADDATLSAEVAMKLEGHAKKFGFRKISDGTVKWLTLVTALFAAPSYGAIEEPENFLDPRMQEIFVSLLRERLAKEPRVFLVSTHSESLLNLCSPLELLVFRFGLGGTTASRPSNAVELQTALKKGLFGLGHYYRVGAVDA